MATLVLTTIGTLVGGPVGGAVGALLGQAVDSRLFAPKARQGPRLGDLSVQTSTYGSEIPKLFGTLRVAGTVIWATDLKETRATSGNGKGQAKSVNYSYSASFAVALSARPILGVRRIWADGKLLRGAAGDFKSATGFRLCLGTEAQAVDPLIASAEGAGRTPAYRGTAYAVFEDFQLADYGNRIPSLTFEVDADPGPVTLAEIAQALAGREIEAGPTRGIGGYAALGESLRGVVESLSEIEPLSLLDTGLRVRIARGGAAAPLALESGEAGARAGAGLGGPAKWARKAASSVPAETTLIYYDPARDYQTGLQRAARGGGGTRGERRSVAAALDAEAAKAIAQQRLDGLWAGRETGTVNLPPRRLDLRPGAVLRIAGKPGMWRLAKLTLEKMVLSAEVERLPPAAGTSLAAAPGRPLSEGDTEAGATELVLLDLPSLQDVPSVRPQLLVAAAGGSGWRAAGLSASYDGGASWQAAGGTAAPAVMGAVIVPPADGGAALLDTAGALEVELRNSEMWLESRSDAALATGANLAVAGEELVQFGVAEPVGDRRFRLSRLLRGRRGTEWATNLHAAGEPFVLIDAATLAAAEPPLSAVGGDVMLRPCGIGDSADAPPVVRSFAGESVRPPSPVHLRCAVQQDGSIAISWVRRSRSGWLWMSGTDAPLVEEREAYRLTLASAGGRRVIETGEPVYAYSLAEQAADGVVLPLTVRVVQLGTAAASRASVLTLF